MENRPLDQVEYAQATINTIAMVLIGNEISLHRLFSLVSAVNSSTLGALHLDAASLCAAQEKPPWMGMLALLLRE